MKKTFQDFIEVLFDQEELVWVGRTTAYKKGNAVFSKASDLKPGKNFFCPNTFKPGNDGNRNSDNIGKIHTLFGEIDDLSLEKQKQIIRENLDLFSAVVFSGNKSFHFFIRLDHDIDYETWRKYQIKLMLVFGGDEKLKNSDRLMRLPFATRTLDDKNKCEQKLNYLGKRKKFGTVKNFLDSKISDQTVLDHDRTRNRVKDSFITSPALTPLRQKHIDQRINDDRNLQTLVAAAPVKGKGDEAVYALCKYGYYTYNWKKYEMAYAALRTRKGKDQGQSWCELTADNLLGEIAFHCEDHESLIMRVCDILSRRGRPNQVELVRAYIEYIRQHFDYRPHFTTIKNLTNKMIQEGILFEEKDGRNKIVLTKPSEANSSLLTNQMFYDLLDDLQVDCEPFFQFGPLSQAVRYVAPGESIVYISKGNTGKTTFLEQLAHFLTYDRDKKVILISCREGDHLSTICKLASMTFSEKIDKPGLAELNLALKQGDKQAASKLERIAKIAEEIEIRHISDEAFSKRGLKNIIDDYVKKYNRRPYAVLFDYFKDSYIEALNKIGYDEYAVAVAEIIGYCKAENIIFATCVQDTYNQNRAPLQYPEDPIIKGAKSFTDPFQIVLWVQGHNPTSDMIETRIAINRIKLHKVKRGEYGQYFTTKVNIDTGRPVDCTGPYLASEHLEDLKDPVLASGQQEWSNMPVAEDGVEFIKV